MHDDKPETSPPRFSHRGLIAGAGAAAVGWQIGELMLEQVSGERRLPGK